MVRGFVKRYPGWDYRNGLPKRTTPHEMTGLRVPQDEARFWTRLGAQREADRRNRDPTIGLMSYNVVVRDP